MPRNFLIGETLPQGTQRTQGQELLFGAVTQFISDYYGPRNTRMTQKRRRNFFFFSAFFRVICGQIIPWGHWEYVATSFVAMLYFCDLCGNSLWLRLAGGTPA
jgi:hypothetical protein